MFKNYSIHYIRTIRNVNIACGLIFILFLIAYLLFFQKNMIVYLMTSFLGESSNMLLYFGTSAFIIALFLLSLLVKRIIGLQGVLSSLCYFPSLLITGVITSFDSSMFNVPTIDELWFWLLPVILIAFFFVIIAIKHLFHLFLANERKSLSLANWNISLLLVQFTITLLVGNTEVLFHYELAADRYMKMGEYDKLSEVGNKSLQSSHYLNALRCLALSSNGTLATKAFEYPQDYGSTGLLFADKQQNNIKFNNKQIYSLLNDSRNSGESGKEYFKRLALDKNADIKAVDYYLISLLLDKEIDEFVTLLPRFYKLDSNLPKHYQEALLVYSIKNGKNFTINPKMKQDYIVFSKKNQTLTSQKERENRARREYGDTYMWYYSYK